MARDLRTRQKYNFLLENSCEIIIFFDKAGRIVDCNKAAKDILGYKDDIYGMSISDIYIDAVSIQNHRIIIDSKYNNVSNDAIAYKKNQTCISVELKIVIDEDHKDFMGLCVAMDITIRKKLIKIVNKLKNDMKNLIDSKNNFIAKITHELRTPVNGIMGMSESLLDLNINLEQKNHVNIIYQCCKNMNSLISDLLDIFKMKCNKLILEERPFDFRLMIDDVIKLNMKQINEKRLKLFTNIAKNIPNIIIGDEYRISQILNNLLSNAIKFTSIGEITINIYLTEQKGDNVELFFMVIDTGIGISIDDIDNLFISFYQADSSITRRYGGTGLGLSICQMLVKAMEGVINVESKINKGSTFSFTVKLKVPSEEGDIDTLNSSRSSYRQREVIVEEGIYPALEDDYAKMLLDGTVQSTDIIGTINENYSSEKFNNLEVHSKHYIKLIMEKLIMTIELEGWSHAEQLGLLIRDIIAKEDKSITNKALQLLFSIRKEERDLSIQRAKELEQMLNEVIWWKM